MKTLIAAAAAATTLALAAPASAEMYGNLGYSHMTTSHNDLDNFTARVGWKSSSWFGVEGEASAGFRADGARGDKVKLKDAYGIYGVASTPINDDASAFLRVGLSSNTVEFSPGGNESHTSWNFGVGANWFLVGDNGVRVEYTRVNFDSNQFEDADVYSLSYVHRFK